MSSYLINNIDIVSKKSPNNMDIYENSIKEMLKRKKDINNRIKKNTNIQNSHEEAISSQNKQKILDLQKSYNHSLILLEKLKEQVEKKIFKKYSIEKTHTKTIDFSNQDSNNILLKKKFLMIPINIILTI